MNTDPMSQQSTSDALQGQDPPPMAGIVVWCVFWWVLAATTDFYWECPHGDPVQEQSEKGVLLFMAPFLYPLFLVGALVRWFFHLLGGLV